MCATDEFKKSRKKNMSFEKNQMFDVFKLARPVCSRLHFNLIQPVTQNPFIFKNVVFVLFFFFCIFNQKTRK